MTGRGRYHHGALREALVAAGEEVLAERGAAGFSLREVARRAGVSPAAPAHHFRDARGLLTTIAARGFETLASALAEAVRRSAPGDRMEAQAMAYFDFAMAHGALFTLMWMRDLLDVEDERYLAAGRDAFNQFERAALARDVPVPSGPHRPDPATIAAWSMIHGFARLALDGALAEPRELLPAIIGHLPKLPGQAKGTGRPA